MSIELIKANFANNIFPYEYNPELWNWCKNHTNCYAYAILDSKVYSPLTSNNPYYFPGAISGNSFYTDCTVGKIINLLEADLNALGKKLFESSLEEILLPGMQKIFILRQRELRGYHFYRLDSNEIWSHKLGWFSYPTNIGINKLNRNGIMDPSLESDSYYQPLGYFKF